MTGPEPMQLTPDQCWERLSTGRLGRVAFIRAAQVEILPVNYRSVDRTILFETSSPVILDAVTAGTEMTFEADDHDGWTAWSVVARGPTVITTDDPPEDYEVRSLLPTPKTARLRITPTTLTGRVFDTAPSHPAQASQPTVLEEDGKTPRRRR